MNSEEYERWVEEIWGDTGEHKADEHITKIMFESGGNAAVALRRMATEYQRLRERFIVSVGLCEEAGEVVQPLKKYVRNPDKNPIDRDKIIDECGDVYYYLCKVLHSVDATLEDAMRVNVEKISKRYGAKV